MREKPYAVVCAQTFLYMHKQHCDMSDGSESEGYSWGVATRGFSYQRGGLLLRETGGATGEASEA